MTEPTPAEFTEQVFPNITTLIEGNDQEWKAAADRIARAAVSDATAYMLASGLASVAQAFIRALHAFGVPVPVTEHTPRSRAEAENIMAAARWFADQMNDANTIEDFYALVERGPRFMAEFYVFLMMSVRQLGREVAYQEQVSRA